MADVFVSYSRRDTEFVQRIAASIESRGKTVWIDTADIADAEVFPTALRTAIEGSDAFLFVISPTSVASQFCEQEVDYAHSLEKRIVPVLRSTVADADVPEEIRQRNWIPFTEADDYDVSLERLVHAIDTDLQHCKEHTRWLVKALEWEAEGRDRSFLLRGSELKAAESWLARTPVDADPAPTTLQNEYILASRRAAARRQRALLGVSVAVTAVAIGLGVLALVSRNQAVSSSNTARSQALAAESENQLSADPEVSVLLARQAVQVAPIPQAVSALRQAMDTSAVRLALPTESVTDCKYQASSFLAYSPDGNRVAGGSCTGEVTVTATSTGRIVYRRHLPVQEDDVAYDPDGRVRAVGARARGSISSTRPPVPPCPTWRAAARSDRWPSASTAPSGRHLQSRRDRLGHRIGEGPRPHPGPLLPLLHLGLHLGRPGPGGRHGPGVHGGDRRRQLASSCASWRRRGRRCPPGRATGARSPSAATSSLSARVSPGLVM